jgi:putative GTP pyrophosphokinase
VDHVCTLLENEFAIDHANSIDKRLFDKADRFGYSSVHYVVKMNEARSNLTEYKQFSNLKFEIQVRTILQHTWASIEHKLGYKSKDEIPKLVRRRFARLSGLLELADEEFVHIREQLDAYDQKLTQANSEGISNEEINNNSISKYCEKKTLVREISQEIATAFSLYLVPDISVEALRIIEKLKVIGVDTIRQLDEALELHRHEIIHFAKEFINLQLASNFSRPLCLLISHSITYIC